MNAEHSPTPGELFPGIQAAAPRGNSAEAAFEKSIPPFHAEVIATYHTILPSAPRVKIWSKTRRQWLDARIAERRRAGKPANTVDYWRRFFNEVKASDFLSGRSSDFVADLEWLLRASNFVKVIEGRYMNRRDRARTNG